jgi:hypothetical protein
MAGTLVITTLSDGTNSTSATNCIQGSAKAWVNYNGVAQSVRASYNVSSVTYNSTGNYTVNFTNAMSDANYNFVFGQQPQADSVFSSKLDFNQTLSAGSINVVTGTPTAATQALTMCVTIFR